MMVPGGCGSQGCHGYLLGSLVAPFVLLGIFPTTILSMGLNTVYVTNLYKVVCTADIGTA